MLIAAVLTFVVPAAAAMSDQATSVSERSANSIAEAMSAGVRGDGQAPQAPLPDGWRAISCTRDGRIYVDPSGSAVDRVSKSIRVTLKGAQLRSVEKMTLPCNFAVDQRSGMRLIVTDGQEWRSYRENNAFGFAPAFGFSEGRKPPYTLSYEAIPVGDLRTDGCKNVAKGHQPAIEQCASFGSSTTFFGAYRNGAKTVIAHFTTGGGAVTEDFTVAEVSGAIRSLFFLPPPDAPGGTITLIFEDGGGLYRAYLDVPRG